MIQITFGKWSLTGTDYGLSWVDGDILTAANLNNLGETIVPIGAVIPWIKSFTSVPQTLPTGFVEADGGVLSDADSVLDGETIPDLNGDARILKGGSTSGTASTLTHTHVLGGQTDSTSASAGTGSNGPHTHGVGAVTVANTTIENTYTTVYIIRVK